MNRSARLSGLAIPLAMLVGAASCGGDSTEPEPTPEVYSTGLSADAVVGNVVSSGTGSASFTVGPQGLGWTIDVNNMDGVTMAHIHGPATPQENADIILTLFDPDDPTGPVNGRLATGSASEGSELLTDGWTLAQVLNLVRNGQTYVLVHTSEYPDGEIRGNLSP